MNDREPEQLERLLRDWQPDLEPDQELKRHVLQRIGWEAEAEETPWYQRTFARPAGFRWVIPAAAAACLLLLLGTITGIQWTERTHARTLAEQRTAYRLLIDPVSRLEADAPTRPPAASQANLVTMLAWMQDRFELRPDQFLALVELHENYEGQFTALYLELAATQENYERFEHRREADEMIDFMALYDLLRHRRDLENEAHATSAELVHKVLEVLDPAQGAAYLATLESLSTHQDA